MKAAPVLLVRLLALAVTVAVLRGGPVESAIVAAMKVPDVKNYTWITTVEDDARTYEVAGQTDRSEFSLVTMPMPAALRRRVTRGSSNTDNHVEAVFKGSEQCVIQTPDGWRKPEELADAARGSPRPGGGGPPSGGFPGGSGSARRGRRGAPGGTAPAYSNLQLNLALPHEEIGVIVGSYTDIRAEGDTVTGTLSDTGAKLLLVHPGQNELTPLAANGTFRLWIRDGALVKYEVTLAGRLSVETSSGRREIDVHQKSTTEVKAVGTTKFDVPDDARKKLGG